MFYFWMIIVLILIFLILIELMTFIHEFGHFMVAKFSKATVVEFAIGFGPAIYQKKVGDTTYSLRALPFGGYVAVLDDNTIEDLKKLKEMNLTPQQAVTLTKQLKIFDKNVKWEDKKTIDKVSSPKKVWFALMGITMNFFMLWAVLFVTYASAGIKEDQGKMYITPYFYSKLTKTTNQKTTKIDSESYEYRNLFYGCEDGYEDHEPIRGETNNIDSDFKDGEEYYAALVEEIETSAAADLKTGKYLIDERLALTYTLKNDVTIKVIDKQNNKNESDDVTISQTWSSNNEYKFNYLISSPIHKKGDSEKDSIGTSYWLRCYDDENVDKNEFKVTETAENGEEFTYAGQSYLQFPVAVEYDKGNKGIVPFNQFGMLVDYEHVGFGKSIYLSLEDSFKYLGKGFVLMFDLLTFGFVIEPQINQLYINSHTMHDVSEANLGLWWGNITFVMIVWMSYLMIVFNVLPFPPLDGWHAFEYAYEGIKKKKVSEDTANLVFKIGIGLFFMILFVPIFLSIF